MKSWGRILFDVTQRMRRAPTLDMLEAIQSEPYESRAKILELQFSRLARLLAVAEAHVPYYREMFRTLGCHSHDIRSVEDLSALPILTKDIIRERLPELIREDQPKQKLILRHSGGSTGVPLMFYRSADELFRCEAGVLANCMQSAWRPGSMVAYFWGFDAGLYAMRSWEFELRQHLRRMYQFDPFHSGSADMDRWLQKWDRLRPAIALGYASTIARFAEHIESSGGQVRPLLGVFTTAEKLYQPQQETIARVFQCRVFDMYGSSEVNNIACSCARGNMHVNAGNVVLEVEGNRVCPGEPSALIVTALNNFSMPFIRYRNEDCGELLDGVCDCGSQSPLMKLDIARVSDNFTLPGGQVVHGEFFTHLMYGSKGIASFQFRQTTLDSIILRVVPGPAEPSARDRAIREAVAQVEGLDPSRTLKVQVEEVETIPLSAAGKHRFTLSDVPPPGSRSSLEYTDAK
jgi:phenylacetate-CoA ligase